MKIKHGQNSLFAVIAKEMPLKVKYFEPSCKGSFQILNEKEYDVFIQDLDRKVDDPDTIRKGRRVFYMFQLLLLQNWYIWYFLSKFMHFLMVPHSKLNIVYTHMKGVKNNVRLWFLKDYNLT